MPKPTEKQLADADIVFEHSLYKPKLEPKYPFALVEVDDVPEPDAKGLRRVDGFKATWEATIEAGWGNPLGNLHGGAAAWLVDTCTSALLVLVHTDSFWGLPHLSGASITLNMGYYHPAPTGTEVYIDCRIVKCTTTIANTRCEIKDRKTGRVYCMGHHIKAWKAPKGKL